mgnify:CR=1 FL=1
MFLTAASKARKKVFDFDFASLDIKGRGAGGNIITRYHVRKISIKSEGVSTMGGLDIWYDDTVGRLNRDQRGKYLGKFHGEDRIVVLYKDGTYELTDFELTNRYEPDKVLWLDKVKEDTVISAVHYDGSSKTHYLKRFQIETSTLAKRFSFISEAPGSKAMAATTDQQSMLEYHYRPAKTRKKALKQIDPKSVVEVKGWKANGNRLSPHKVLDARFSSETSKPPLPKPEKTDPPSKPVTAETESNTGFQVGSTIEFDVSSGKEQRDQLGLFEQQNEN